MHSTQIQISDGRWELTSISPSRQSSFFFFKDVFIYFIHIKLFINQIIKQSAYLSCEPISYDIKASNQKANVTTAETNVYLFLKTSSTKDIRLDLGVPYATNVTLKDKQGRTLSYTKENINGNLVIKLKGNTLPAISTTPTKSNINSAQGYGASTTLEEVLKNKDYLHLTLEGVDSFTISTYEYIQVS